MKKKILYYILTNCVYKHYVSKYYIICPNLTNITIFIIIIIIGDYQVIDMYSITL